MAEPVYATVWDLVIEHWMHIEQLHTGIYAKRYENSKGFSPPDSNWDSAQGLLKTINRDIFINQCIATAMDSCMDYLDQDRELAKKYPDRFLIAAHPGIPGPYSKSVLSKSIYSQEKKYFEDLCTTAFGKNSTQLISPSELESLIETPDPKKIAKLDAHLQKTLKSARKAGRDAAKNCKPPDDQNKNGGYFYLSVLNFLKNPNYLKVADNGAHTIRVSGMLTASIDTSYFEPPSYPPEEILYSEVTNEIPWCSPESLFREIPTSELTRGQKLTDLSETFSLADVLEPIASFDNPYLICAGPLLSASGLQVYLGGSPAFSIAR